MYCRLPSLVTCHTLVVVGSGAPASCMLWACGGSCSSSAATVMPGGVVACDLAPAGCCLLVIAKCSSRAAKACSQCGIFLGAPAGAHCSVCGCVASVDIKNFRQMQLKRDLEARSCTAQRKPESDDRNPQPAATPDTKP